MWGRGTGWHLRTFTRKPADTKTVSYFFWFTSQMTTRFDFFASAFSFALLFSSKTVIFNACLLKCCFVPHLFCLHQPFVRAPLELRLLRVLILPNTVWSIQAEEASFIRDTKAGVVTLSIRMKSRIASNIEAQKLETEQVAGRNDSAVAL